MLKVSLPSHSSLTHGSLPSNHQRSLSPTAIMTLIKLSALVVASVFLSSCAQEDLDYFMNGPRDGSYQPVQRSDDSGWYAQQNAAREANQRAVQEQAYKNQMQNYKSGYSNTLPNIPSY